MKKYAFKMDAAKCIGCRTCTMACKNYNQLLPQIQWRKVYPLAENIYPHRERAFYSLACNHCEKPACHQACPTNSYTKREDNIVVHNQDTCIGCTNCVRACPFGAPQYNPVEKRVEKCSMCVERLDAGLMPACVKGCPVKAIEIIDLSEYSEADAVQYPEGFPKIVAVNPSTRFIEPKAPSSQVRG